MTRSRHRRCFELRAVAAAATFALGLSAAAPAARAQAEGDAVATYESHVRRGTELFQVGDYAAARGEFLAAYDIHGEPTLLFNIASTHRREGDAGAALEAYRRFLDAAPSQHPNRELAEETVAELEAELAAGDDDGDGAETEGESESETEPSALEVDPAADLDSPDELGPALQSESPPRDQPADPGSRLRIAGAVTVSAGAVALIAAAVDLRRAADYSDQLEGAPEGAWTAELQSYYDSGQRAESRAVVVGGLGLAAVATGAVLYWLGERRDDAGVDLEVSAGPGSAQVGVTGRF